VTDSRVSDRLYSVNVISTSGKEMTCYFETILDSEAFIDTIDVSPTFDWTECNYARPDRQ
jgi:hypothetical protein